MINSSSGSCHDSDVTWHLRTVCSPWLSSLYYMYMFIFTSHH